MVVRKNKIPISFSTILIAVIVILISVGFLIVSGGNVAAAMVPTFVYLAVIALFNAPLKYSVMTLYGAALLLTSSGETPHEGKWRGPFTLVGDFLFGNISNLTGISPLKISAIQIALFTFLFIIFLRTLLNNNLDGHLDLKAARSLKIAAFGALLAVSFSTVRGILRGGDTSIMPLQMSTLAFCALSYIACMRAFKDEQMYPVYAKMLVGISILRIAEGAWYYFSMLKPSGLDYEYVMTHDDSFGFAGAIMLLVITAIEKNNIRSLLSLLGFGGIILWGSAINDRRVCYVAMGACVITLYFFLAPQVRKKINKISMYLLPAVFLYIGVGMNSGSKIFAPVHAFTSVSDSTDPSTLSRKVENINLIHTISGNPVIGTGFGFPYKEIIPSFKLGYEWYRYLAHNHLLWLSYIMGGVGLFFLFSPLMVTIFLAVRVYRFAQTPQQRIVSLMAICSVIIYLVMAFGDMGAISLKGILLLTSTGAMVANLSRKLKAI
ncbi:MAG: hypothetical protein JXX14_07635 [Deltaproteobacteria bacterium]|nr:hypothetical protein [Deltaproteobacteria bacterium]